MPEMKRSIPQTRKQKRKGGKKEVGIGNSFVLQEQGCNTGRIFLKAQKVEKTMVDGWEATSNKQPSPIQDGECPKTIGS